MALDRWLALAILGICLIYGYAAWFTMDAALPRFMMRNPVWPSTFPKVLSIMGILAATWVVLKQGPMPEPTLDDIDPKRLFSYKWGQALALIALMLVYAATLRPLGFMGSTVGFLVIGAAILGERRIWVSIPVALLAGGSIWWLVSEVLGIFLRPLPQFMM